MTTSEGWLWFLSHRKQIGLWVAGFVAIFRGSLLFAEQTVVLDTLARLAEVLILGSVATAAAGASKSDSFYRETLARVDVGLPERRGGSRQREAIAELKAVSAAPVLAVVRAVEELKAADSQVQELIGVVVGLPERSGTGEVWTPEQREAARRKAQEDR